MPNLVQSVLTGSRPDVAVIIPCYNYAGFLRGCVESVLRWTRLRVQVIVVDDASTDETPAVCGALAAQDARIRVVRHKVNRGHIATYNHALDLVDANYIHLISADDELTPFALDRAVGILTRHDDVGLVYGRALVVSPSERASPRIPERIAYSIVKGTDWVEARCRDARNPVRSPEVTLRGAIAIAAGPYDPRLPNVADLEMWLRVAARSNVAIIENADQALYRLHQLNMHMAAGKAGYIQGLRELVNAYEIFFSGHAHLLPDPKHLRVLARARVARDALWRSQLAFDEDKATVDNLLEAMEFAESMTTEPHRIPEWKMVQRRRTAGSRWLLRRLMLGRLTTRARRWWDWQVKNRDLGHQGLRVLYSGRLP